MIKCKCRCEGPPGPPGDPGFNGYDGFPGPCGPAGGPGPTGPNGPNGINGSPGVDGANGTPGQDGQTGSPGPSGPDGAIGTTGTPSQAVSSFTANTGLIAPGNFFSYRNGTSPFIPQILSYQHLDGLSPGPGWTLMQDTYYRVTLTLTVTNNSTTTNLEGYFQLRDESPSGAGAQVGANFAVPFMPFNVSVGSTRRSNLMRMDQIIHTAIQADPIYLVPYYVAGTVSISIFIQSVNLLSLLGSFSVKPIDIS